MLRTLLLLQQPRYRLREADRSDVRFRVTTTAESVISTVSLCKRRATDSRVDKLRIDPSEPVSLEEDVRLQTQYLCPIMISAQQRLVCVSTT